MSGLSKTEILMGGDLKVLDTGVLLLPSPFADITFFINEKKIYIEFSNPYHGPDTSNQLFIHKIDSDTVHIECSNWYPYNSRSLDEPIKIFDNGNEDIFINLLVENLGKKPRVTYTFFVKKN